MPAYTEYYFQLWNKRTQRPINDDTGKYIVMTVDTPTLATIYSDSQGTAPAFVATNVASTLTDGVGRFWTAQSVESVDVSILTAGGQAIFIKGMTPSEHRIEVDVEKRDQKLIFPYYNYIPTPYVSASVTATGSAWSPGFSLPANSYVRDAWIRTYTLGTTSTINFGVSGTPSGLVQGVTAAVTGVHYPLPMDSTLTGGTATFTRGTLLVPTSTNVSPYPKWYVTPGATGLVFYDNTSTVLAAGCGWVYICYDKMPV